MATNKKPLAKIRHGFVNASIWEQPGKTGLFLTVSFSRSYKDKQDQWKHGHSYNIHEIESLINVAIDAQEWVRNFRKSQGRAA